MKKLNYKELLEKINNAQREQEKTIIDLHNIAMLNGGNLQQFEQANNKSVVRALKKIEKIIYNEIIKTIDNYIDNFSKESFESFCIDSNLESVCELYNFLSNKGDNENE